MAAAKETDNNKTTRLNEYMLDRANEKAAKACPFYTPHSDTDIRYVRNVMTSIRLNKRIE